MLFGEKQELKVSEAEDIGTAEGIDVAMAREDPGVRQVVLAIVTPSKLQHQPRSESPL